MKLKAHVAISTILIVVILMTMACSAGFLAGRTATPNAPSGPVVQMPASTMGAESTQGLANPTPTAEWQPKTRDELFAPFWQAWDIVHQQYVDQPVDDIALMRGAISGMMQALGDKHSSYMDPDMYRQANTPLVQEYEGIGAWVDTNAEYLTIVSPMPGSPAEAAGLKAGDEIIAIDGKDQTGIDGNVVIKSVLGPAGTKVTLTIRRAGTPDPFDVEVTRAKITVPSVEGKMLDGGIAYIQLLQFAENSRQELRDKMTELMAQNPKGMILDLRNNGGGYLHTAVEVASEFIDNGVILYEVYGDGRKQSYEALGNGMATNIPLVVLVNEGTASASEIVSGALQDYGRAKLVGVTTYGKGSVQNWVPLDNNQGAVRVTIARWLTPKERQINEVGLTPDVVVELTQADIQANRDPQLDKAIELLGGTPPTPQPVTPAPATPQPTTQP